MNSKTHLSKKEANLLIENAESSDESLKRLVTHPEPEVRERLADRYKVSYEILALLAQDQQWSVRRAVVDRDDCPISIAKKVLAGATKKQRLELSHSYWSSPAVFQEIAESGSDEERIAVASNSSNYDTLEIKQLELLAKDKCTAVRENVAENLSQRLSLEQLQELSNDRMVALLKKLATDPVWSVRSEMANIGNCPVDILKALLNKSTAKQRCELAETIDERLENAEFLIDSLAIDPSPEVRYRVARLNKAPSNILEQLAQDTEEIVREAVSVRRKRDAPLLQRCKDPDEWVRIQMVNDLGLPAIILEKLASDESEFVRWEVATHQNTPAEVRYYLATKGGVAGAMLGTIYATPEILLHVARNGNEEERLKAVDHDNLSAEAMMILADDTSEAVRAALAKSSHATPQVLEKLAKDKAEQVRRKVARNHNTPGKVLKKLEKDPAIVADRERRRAILSIEQLSDVPTNNSKKINGFRKMQLRLREEGWYVEWALPCCQSCAWGSIPYAHKEGPFIGKEINRRKVLFTHEQDCEIACDWDDETEERILPEKYKDRKFETMPCYFPEEVQGSHFGFSGSDEGVENLREVKPIIEESGCKIIWSGDGDERPYIGWIE